jgi:hypothetical protein
MSVFLGAEPRTHSCWQFERAGKRRPVQKRFPDDSITSSLIGWVLSLELEVAASGARHNVIPVASQELGSRTLNGAGALKCPLKANPARSVNA